MKNNIVTIQVEGMHIDFNEKIINPTIKRFMNMVKEHNLTYKEEYLTKNDDIEDTLYDESQQHLIEQYSRDITICLLNNIEIEFDTEDIMAYLYKTVIQR